jgi:uncharacterized protein
MHQSVDPQRLKLADDPAAGGVLLGFRCRDCGVSVFGAAIFCQSCTSGNLEPVELAGRGTLYSYTIVRVPPAGWPGSVPYILGEVELPEGPHVLAEVIDCGEPELRIGMAVELALQPVDIGDPPETLMVYKWRPATGQPTTHKGGA